MVDYDGDGYDDDHGHGYRDDHGHGYRDNRGHGYYDPGYSAPPMRRSSYRGQDTGDLISDLIDELAVPLMGVLALAAGVVAVDNYFDWGLVDWVAGLVQEARSKG